MNATMTGTMTAGQTVHVVHTVKLTKPVIAALVVVGLMLAGFYFLSNRTTSPATGIQVAVQPVQTVETIPATSMQIAAQPATGVASIMPTGAAKHSGHEHDFGGPGKIKTTLDPNAMVGL